MDRIAIISDIHGNMPALEAVLTDIKEREIHRIICLGDMVGKGPSSDLAFDRVMNVCEAVVKGNWEDSMTRSQTSKVRFWHQQKLGRERIEAIRKLPFSVDFLMSGKSVRLFHASARSLYGRVYPDDALAVRQAMFHNTDKTGFSTKVPEVIGYGDIHIAFIQHFKGKTLFNAGSVGNPLDITQASYVIMEGTYNSSVKAPFSIQFVRVPYDIELAIRQAKAEDMPKLEEYIKELRTGIYRGDQMKS